MKLQPNYYEYIKTGTKRIEIRLYDQKRKQLKIGDTIIFTKEPENIENQKVVITNIKKFSNFNELIDNYDIALLASPITTKKELLNELNSYYPSDKQSEYGVVAIEFTKGE